MTVATEDLEIVCIKQKVDIVRGPIPNRSIGRFHLLFNRNYMVNLDAIRGEGKVTLLTSIMEMFFVFWAEGLRPFPCPGGIRPQPRFTQNFDQKRLILPTLQGVLLDLKIRQKKERNWQVFFKKYLKLNSQGHVSRTRQEEPEQLSVFLSVSFLT